MWTTSHKRKQVGCVGVCLIGRTGRCSRWREGLVPVRSKGRKQQGRWKELAVELRSSTEHRMCMGGNEAAGIGRRQVSNLEARVRTVTALTSQSETTIL